VKLTYSEKLKDPRWQKVRLEIMERDKFTCLVCRATEKTLNVHHCYYRARKEPWEAGKNSLLTLCEDCHKSVEVEGTPAWRWQAGMLSSAGAQSFFNRELAKAGGDPTSEMPIALLLWQMGDRHPGGVLDFVESIKRALMAGVFDEGFIEFLDHLSSKEETKKDAKP